MTATPTPKPRLQRRVLGLSIAGAIVLALGAVGAGYVVGLDATSSAAESAGVGSGESPARPAPESGAPVAPLPEPSTEPVSLVPADCSGIYSTDWSTQMDGLVLNPAWSSESGQPAIIGSSDEELEATLQAAAPLTCRWGNEQGGSDRALVTNVAQLHGDQSEASLARMNAIGYDCYDELGGTRCIVESKDDNGTWGESHFLRDGVWVATRWMNIAPDGYTHDIVNTLWP
ncbi:hypothetical protein [Microterricola viridarii]|uniref:Uncharacterized protein n=1 Tax=Microterricola viridarii TaxID=412690 RepID=A0A0Y0MT99_9MICO|nr:hypothetical protein [Microterricola viridarii]AMB57652.1 hypothetical protein AWU67_00890 [Microterricola viridarii]